MACCLKCQILTHLRQRHVGLSLQQLLHQRSKQSDILQSTPQDSSSHDRILLPSSTATSQQQQQQDFGDVTRQRHRHFRRKHKNFHKALHAAYVSSFEAEELDRLNQSNLQLKLISLAVAFAVASTFYTVLVRLV